MKYAAILRAVLALASIWVVTSCSVVEVRSPDDGHVSDWNTLLENTATQMAELPEATAALVSDIQLGGTVLRSHLDQAAHNAAACLEDAGIIPMFTDPKHDYGGYGIAWGFDFGYRDESRADALDAIGYACMDNYYYPIEFLYTDQTLALERADEEFERMRATMLDCLGRASMYLDEEATTSEIGEALHVDLTQRGEESCTIELGL